MTCHRISVFLEITAFLHPRISIHREYDLLPSNRSEQIIETCTGYSTGNQFTRQRLNEKQHSFLHHVHGFTEKCMAVPCMLFYIQTLPRILRAGAESRVRFLGLFGPIPG